MYLYVFFRLFDLFQSRLDDESILYKLDSSHFLFLFFTQASFVAKKNRTLLSLCYTGF